MSLFILRKHIFIHRYVYIHSHRFGGSEIITTTSLDGDIRVYSLAVQYKIHEDPKLLLQQTVNYSLENSHIAISPILSQIHALTHPRVLAVASKSAIHYYNSLTGEVCISVLYVCCPVCAHFFCSKYVVRACVRGRVLRSLFAFLYVSFCLLFNLMFLRLYVLMRVCACMYICFFFVL
jgi:hypothetical protein